MRLQGIQDLNCTKSDEREQEFEETVLESLRDLGLASPTLINNRALNVEYKKLLDTLESDFIRSLKIDDTCSFLDGLTSSDFKIVVQNFLGKNVNVLNDWALDAIFDVEVPQVEAQLDLGLTNALYQDFFLFRDLLNLKGNVSKKVKREVLSKSIEVSQTLLRELDSEFNIPENFTVIGFPRVSNLVNSMVVQPKLRHEELSKRQSVNRVYKNLYKPLFSELQKSKDTAIAFASSSKKQAIIAFTLAGLASAAFVYKLYTCGKRGEIGFTPEQELFAKNRWARDDWRAI